MSASGVRRMARAPMIPRLVLALIFAVTAVAFAQTPAPVFKDSDTLCCVTPTECYRAAACPAPPPPSPFLTHGPRSAARAPSVETACDLGELRRAAIQWAHMPQLTVFSGPASSEQYRRAAVEMDVREQAESRLRRATEACR